MLVLLIDGVGHVREYEVSDLVPVMLIPMPDEPVEVWAGEPEDRPPLSFHRARFERTDEESWPPVYRLKP